MAVRSCSGRDGWLRPDNLPVLAVFAAAAVDVGTVAVATPQIVVRADEAAALKDVSA